jgi:Flp pilus assembly pilin Flp
MESKKQHVLKFLKGMMRRALVEEKATAFAEYGLVFVLIAAIVLVLAVVTGGGSLIFFQQVEPIS